MLFYLEIWPNLLSEFPYPSSLQWWNGNTAAWHYPSVPTGKWPPCNYSYFVPILSCISALLQTDSSPSFWHVCTYPDRPLPTFSSLSIQLETRRKDNIIEGSSMCVCACVFVFVCLTLPSVSLPVADQMPVRRGSQQVFEPLPGTTEAWSQPFLRPALPRPRPRTAWLHPG